MRMGVNIAYTPVLIECASSAALGLSYIVLPLSNRVLYQCHRCATTLIRRKLDDHSLPMSLQPVIDVPDLGSEPLSEYQDLEALGRVRRRPPPPCRPSSPPTTTTAHDSTAFFAFFAFFAFCALLT